MLRDTQDMKVNMYIRPHVDGRLRKVKYMSYVNHKNMLVLNDVARNVGDMNGSKLGREQFKTSTDFDRDSLETKKSLARKKMLRKCLKMRRIDSSILRNPKNDISKFGHYGGLTLDKIAGDIDLFVSDDFRKLKKLQKAQERMQSGQNRGFILQNDEIVAKCHDYLEQKWGVVFPKPKKEEEKWKSTVHEQKLSPEDLPPVFSFYKPYRAKPKPLKQIKPHRRKTRTSVLITDLSDARSHISEDDKKHSPRADISVISAGTRPRTPESVVAEPRKVGGTRRLSNVGLLDEPPIDAIRRMSMMSMNSEASHHLSVPDSDNYFGVKENEFVRLQSIVKEESFCEDIDGEIDFGSFKDMADTSEKKHFLPKIVVGKGAVT